MKRHRPLGQSMVKDEKGPWVNVVDAMQEIVKRDKRILELEEDQKELRAELETAQKNLAVIEMETRAQCALEYAKSVIGEPNQKLYVCIEGGCLTAVVGPADIDFDVEIVDQDNADCDEDEEIRVGELENEMNDLMEEGKYRDYTEYVPGEEE